MTDSLTPEKVTKLTLRVDEWGNAEFVAADGRVMFEVCPRKDGRSIEVRSISTCKVGGRFYGTELLVAPRVTNVVHISTVPYDDE